MKDYHILIVDDEKANIYLLEESLQDYIISSASNAEEAYIELERDIPDLILLDIMMPGTDGLTIAQHLKKEPRYSGIPIIFISALTSGESVAKGLGTGAEDYIKKPFESSELVARVRKVLESSDRASSLYRRATRDNLTGLFNREYFFEKLEQDIRKSERDRTMFSVGIIDIDHFKNVNDTYGHQAGDRVLRLLASLLGNSLRGSDMVARYGGEEFVFLLDDSGRENAASVIDRVRLTVAETELDSEKHIFITFSCGISDLSEVSGSDDAAGGLISIADRRLYSAKNSGRNRVIFNG